MLQSPTVCIGRLFMLLLVAACLVAGTTMIAYSGDYSNNGDDGNSSKDKNNAVELSEDEIRLLDEVFTFYYLAPSPEKIGVFLDIINNTELLRTRTAHAPISAFLSKVFSDNTEFVYSWMTRNDYNSYAQDIIVNALINAGLKRDAYIFAEAHGWKKAQLALIEDASPEYDFATMGIYVAGHIDVLWALFSATGDESYVNRIIDYLFYPAPLPSADKKTKELSEITLKHAIWTLQSNVLRHARVRDIIAARIEAEKDKQKIEILNKILYPPPRPAEQKPETENKEN